MKGWTSFSGGNSPSTVEFNPIIFSYFNKGEKLLDIGCGNGNKSLELAKRGYHVTGIDINQNEIEYACNSMANIDVKGSVRYICADACELPFGDNEFDGFVMQSFLTTIIDPFQRQKVVSEACRVLRPGGIGYMGVFAISPNSQTYLFRYILDFPKTFQWATFMVRDKETGADLFMAHHYSKKEVEKLISPYFLLERYLDARYISYHGNVANGMIFIVKKST